jgi:molybdopterin molybdotransferase
VPGPLDLDSLDDLTPVDEALDLVLEQARALPPEAVSLRESLDRVLAEDAIADVDVPPFDRCAMDGYALRAEDVADAPTSLKLVGRLFAGEVFAGRVERGQAVKVMTGAPRPEGADAVQMVERAREEGERVVIYDAVEPGRHVAPLGEDLRRGQTALAAGARIGPAEIGLLATVGLARVVVHARPSAAVLSTGDELVDVAERPGPGRIRNSNGPMLAALARDLGCAPVDELPPARDSRESLEEALERGLAAHLLLISGGVSKGERDLVGDVLAERGVRPVFHGIDLQPGKPLWFGVGPDGSLVFGLPGNPVSSLTTGRVFAGAAVRRLRGLAQCRPRPVRAVLAEAFARKARRPGWLPAALERDGGRLTCLPLSSSGSADLTAASRASATWIAPKGQERFRAGEEVEVLPHEDWLER